MKDTGWRIAVSLTVLVVWIAVLTSAFSPARAAKLPEGYWTLEQSNAVLDKTLTIMLHPDISQLSPAERGVAQQLLEVGRIFHKLYVQSRHHQARGSYETLVDIDDKLNSPKVTQNLLDLYYLFKGPIARSLDNSYVSFLPVDETVPGKAVYPWGITKEAIERYLSAHPNERSSILHVRSVVRQLEEETVEADLAVLSAYPVIAEHHPGLKKRLRALKGREDENVFYSVPYSVAYANDLMNAHRLLLEAASIIKSEDSDLALYLEDRALDLLTDEYEPGDAAWVTGQFKNLNAQIGSYEVYDDELFGVKSFFSLSLLLRDQQKSDALRSAVKGMQAYEKSLPYKSRKRVKENIPVGVYNVIADFGQARGANTATILPNESHIVREYGRTILIRQNIIRNHKLFAVAMRKWQAAVVEDHFDDLQPEGNFYRTLWHEIGHYLGPDLDKKGRTHGESLEEVSQIIEELKADLVSLFLTNTLFEQGYYSEELKKSVYASGIRRVLLKNRPRRSQSYQMMELMQMNFFIENGLLVFDQKSKRLRVDYSRYHECVEAMLEQVLSLQVEGDKAEANRFIDQYSTWNDDLHEVLATRMREEEQYRYVIVRYGVLEEE